MKNNKEELNGQGAVNASMEDLSPQVETVLKTLILLERSYGINYLVNLLSGESMAEYREGHQELETYGELGGFQPGKLFRLVHVMVDEGLVGPGNPLYSTLAITDAGRAWLDASTPFVVQKSRLSMKPHQYWLRDRLRKFRRKITEDRHMPAFKVLANFVIDRIAVAEPGSLDELLAIEGMTQFKAELYGAHILSMVREAHEVRREREHRKRMQRAKTPTIQQTLDLALKGCDLEEIAEAKKISPVTVVSYLEDLHFSGEHDMHDWIEEHVDSKVLYQGAEYFKRVGNPRMREAYEATGLDYHILRLCRLYVSEPALEYQNVAV